MKILAIADTEERLLWESWNKDTAARLSDVGLILSAGDLGADYLEFIVTMLDVPLVYVRGNHDGAYNETPPGGCIDADGRVIEVKCPVAGGKSGYGNGEEGLRTIRILGLGGSMRYRPGAEDMYSEAEMYRRVMKAGIALAADNLKGKKGFDILLTHAPCKGYGDMEDIAHNGFACFEWLLKKYRPVYHVYGHVHKEYGRGMSGGEDPLQIRGYRKSIDHPSGTTLINASGYRILEI